MKKPKTTAPAPERKFNIVDRPPWERMMRFHEHLQKNDYPNCPKMAAELGVRVRTIMRDLDFMKDRLKLPIKYDELRYGFYYTKTVDHFPHVGVTESELFALLVASKAITQYQGTAWHRPLENAFRKLTGQLEQDTRFTMGSLDRVLSFRPFAPGDTDLAAFQRIHAGLQKARVLEFDYKNLGARQVQRRRVQPYHLACIDNHWYLFAFDEVRQALRTFVLTRMSRLALTRKHFKRPKHFNADEYLRGSFQVYKGHADYEVVVEFDAWATDLLRGRKWHSSQETTELPQGGCRLRLRLNNLEEIEGWILSWGRHATVIRPLELAERLRGIAEDLATRYVRTRAAARDAAHVPAEPEEQPQLLKV